MVRGATEQRLGGSAASVDDASKGPTIGVGGGRGVSGAGVRWMGKVFFFSVANGEGRVHGGKG